jgi:putative transposase
MRCWRSTTSQPSTGSTCERRTPFESTFATVRHRTIRSKGCLSNKTALAMVFKLVEGAQKSWRRIDGPNQLPKLIQGVKFADGIEVIGNSAVAQAQAAA